MSSFFDFFASHFLVTGYLMPIYLPEFLFLFLYDNQPCTLGSEVSGLGGVSYTSSESCGLSEALQSKT